MKSKVGKIVLIAVIALVLAVALCSCFTVVQAGHTGVVTTFGAVSDKVLSEGIHFKIPFVQQVIQVNNSTQKIETLLRKKEILKSLRKQFVVSEM